MFPFSTFLSLSSNLFTESIPSICDTQVQSAALYMARKLFSLFLFLGSKCCPWGFGFWLCLGHSASF